MDLAEAHIRTPDMGASASATLRPRSASRARACIIISPPRPRWLLLSPGVTETVSLPSRSAPEW